MATEFDIWLPGDDLEHLDAVATLICEEIDRAERLLSRFDPASETYRINQQARERPLALSVELTGALRECRAAYRWTEGAFDVVTNPAGDRLGWDSIEFDDVARTVAIRAPSAMFDFGAYGKGYALDRAAEILAQYSVTNARLGGGGSSWLVRGSAARGSPWQVKIDSWDGAPFELFNGALSTSATFRGDVIDADTRTRWNPADARGHLQCTVSAQSAALAEIASTAGLVLGPAAVASRMSAWQEQSGKRIKHALWLWGEPSQIHSLIFHARSQVP